jgi:hypothetical protein
MRWQLILEEYDPEIIYTNGSTNIVADALSRLNLNALDKNVIAQNFVMIREHKALLYGMEKQKEMGDVVASTFPFSDIKLLKLLQSHDEYPLKIFRGGGKRYGLIVRDDKIIIPTNL